MILEFFQQNNFDILGLSEIGIQKNHERSSYTHHLLNLPNTNDTTHIKIYYDTNSDNTHTSIASGTALIVSETFSKHIIKTSHFKGRVLSMDLNFKRKQYIRIINV